MSSVAKSEKRIIQHARMLLEENGWLFLKFHGDRFQVAGLPDVLAIKDGFHLWIEFKRFGKKPTKIQTYMLGKLQSFGAHCIWTDDPFSILEFAEDERARASNQRD